MQMLLGFVAGLRVQDAILGVPLIQHSVIAAFERSKELRNSNRSLLPA
jgi:hypothetical protein